MKLSIMASCIRLFDLMIFDTKNFSVNLVKYIDIFSMCLTIEHVFIQQIVI